MSSTPSHHVYDAIRIARMVQEPSYIPLLPRVDVKHSCGESQRKGVIVRVTFGPSCACLFRSEVLACVEGNEGSRGEVGFR